MNDANGPGTGDTAGQPGGDTAGHAGSHGDGGAGVPGVQPPPSSRREVLIGAGFAAAAGVGATLVPRYLGARPAVRDAPGSAAALVAAQRHAWLTRPEVPPTGHDWVVLRNSLSTHRLFRPGERGYGQAKLLFEPRFDSLEPAGVAYCRTTADVAACLSFVTRFKLPVRVRSGGHSYTGWSSVTGGLVLDVSQMSGFAAGKGAVRVGTGLDLINFYAKLAGKGMAVPGGSCPTVGIAGLALGGGVGVLTRMFGLTSDNLEAVQMVTADGSVLECDAHSHSDLYWACRGGGGGNFGVATSFTFRTHKLHTIAVFFLSWPWSQAARVVNAWQSWAPFAPDALWSNMHLSAAPGGPPGISVGGTYVGSVAGLARHLDALYAKVGTGPSSRFVREESYLDAMLLEAGCASVPLHACHTGPGGHLPRVPSYAKSDFFTRKLNAAGIRALLSGIERLRGVRGAAGGAGSIAFDACGGAMNRVHPQATAFVHRNALFLAQYSTVWTWPGSPQGVRNQYNWLVGYYKSLHPHASGQAYQNYIDAGLKDWPAAYYGANYKRLTQVKTTYDPHQLFSFPQSIKPG
jgi:FAD/FMN-containing dehydrogenase